MDDNGILLLLAFSALACGPYLAWFSRWNIIGHFKLALTVVAYVIPITVFQVHRAFPPEVVRSFTQMLVTGAVAYTLGIFYAKFILRPATGTFLRSISLDEPPEARALVEKRIWVALVAGAVLMVVSFLGMGFVPLFAEDPLEAKFLRGDYKASYDRVSVLYRLAWVILPTLIGLAVLLSFQRAKAFKWRVLTVVVVALLFLTLSRTSIAQGVLVLVVIVLIWRRHTLIAILATVATYVAGALFYRLVAWAGIEVFGEVQVSDRSVLEEITATVPDVTDALSFWARWEAAGSPLAGGHTLYGGLIPGNYPWNPSVWSITLGNPNVDITQIASGGLRLPAPVWGYVNFELLGAILVPFVAGLLTAWVLVKVSRVVPATNLFSTVLILTLADALITSLLGTFYKVSYLGVIEIAMLVWILSPYRGVRKRPLSKLYGSSNRTRERQRRRLMHG